MVSIVERAVVNTHHGASRKHTLSPRTQARGIWQVAGPKSLRDRSVESVHVACTRSFEWMRITHLRYGSTTLGRTMHVY